jgi:hypothetical protein
VGRDADDTLRCAACGYQAPNEGGVFNLLPSAERKDLYPGNREDVIDFSLPGHEKRLLEGWYDLEGVFGNKFRWIGGSASAHLRRVSPHRQRLRVRGHAHQRIFEQGHPVRVEIHSNGLRLGQWRLERAGLFVFEADLPDSPEYKVDFHVTPTWRMPPDERTFSVTLSMIRLAPRDPIS